MTLLQLTIFFILFTGGYTMIITESKIMQGFRALYSKMGTMAAEFIECPMCVGFWVAIGFNVFFDWFDLVLKQYFFVTEINSINAIIYQMSIGVMGSFMIWTLFCLREFLYPTPEDNSFQEEGIGQTEQLNISVTKFFSKGLAKELEDDYGIILVRIEDKNISDENKIESSSKEILLD